MSNFRSIIEDEGFVFFKIGLDKAVFTSLVRILVKRKWSGIGFYEEGIATRLLPTRKTR